jgi:hypothetical protein
VSVRHEKVVVVASAVVAEAEDVVTVVAEVVSAAGAKPDTGGMPSVALPRTKKGGEG